MKAWNAELTQSGSNITKEHKAAVKRASKIVNKWRPKIDWIREWDGNIQAVPQEYGGMTDASMCIEMEDLWHRATISIRPNAIFLSEEDFEICILHELSHIFVNEFMMTDMDYDDQNIHIIVERACWRLAKTLYNMKES